MTAGTKVRVKSTKNLGNASNAERLGHRLRAEPRQQRGIRSDRKGLLGQSRDLHLSPKVLGSKLKA